MVSVARSSFWVLSIATILGAPSPLRLVGKKAFSDYVIHTSAGSVPYHTLTKYHLGPFL